MKCNVKGNRLSRKDQKELQDMIFGAVFPGFRDYSRYKASHETEERLKKIRKEPMPEPVTVFLQRSESETCTDLRQQEKTPE